MRLDTTNTRGVKRDGQPKRRNISLVASARFHRRLMHPSRNQSAKPSATSITPYALQKPHTSPVPNILVLLRAQASRGPRTSLDATRSAPFLSHRPRSSANAHRPLAPADDWKTQPPVDDIDRQGRTTSPKTCCRHNRINVHLLAPNASTLNGLIESIENQEQRTVLREANICMNQNSVHCFSRRPCSGDRNRPSAHSRRELEHAPP